MARNLTNLYISQSFEYLVQLSASAFETGLGVAIPSINITASNAVSSSYALTASFALNAGGATVDTGSLMKTGSVNSNTLTFTKGDGSTFDLTVATGSASTTPTGSLLITASATNNVITFTKGDASTFNVTVATGSAVTVDTGSLMKTGSVNSNVLTFTKGDGSTFNLTVNTGSAVTTPTGSLLTTASAAANVITFTKGDGSTFPVTIATGSAVSASFASTASLALLNVLTASSNNDTITYTKGDATTFTNVINNVSASISSSRAVSASRADSALSASYAVSASYSNTSTSASYAVSASYAENATTAITASFATNFTASNILVTGLATITSASITNLLVIYETASVIYSSGSNQFGDASNDIQTLYGTVDVKTGPLLVTGSTISTLGFTGSLQGTASYATQALSASFATSALSASYALTASYVDLGTSNGTAFTASATWNYNHNLGTQLITIDTYDSNYEEIIPQTIDLTDDFNAVITFPTAVAGFAVASLGNGVTSVTNNITQSINNITQSITNSYFDTSPSSVYSNYQAELFSGTASYTTTISSVGVYNIHVSQSGTYFINATGLATLSASVNCYYYPELFPTSSMAILGILAGTGSSNVVAIRTLVSASSTYEWWNSNSSAIGTSNATLARNASRKTLHFAVTATAPTVMYKNSQGLVSLTPSSVYPGTLTNLYSHTGSEGTALV